MFKAILYTQWKWSRVLVLLATVAAFAIPVLSVRHMGRPSPSPWQVAEALNSVRAWGLWYPLLGLAFAGLLSTYTWLSDISGKHVYALSLPVPRWHYVLLRLSAGMVLLAPAVLAMWVGSLLAVASASIPQGLNAYPHALTFRFALMLAVLYTLVASVTAMPKPWQTRLGLVLVALVALEVLSGVAGTHVRFFSGPLLQLFRWPGPLEILAGRWVLIDV